MNKTACTSATWFWAGFTRRASNGKVETLIASKHIGEIAFNETGEVGDLRQRRPGDVGRRTAVRDIVTHWEGKPLQFNNMTPDNQGSIYAGIFGYDVFAHAQPRSRARSTVRMDPPGRMVLISGTASI